MEPARHKRPPGKRPLAAKYRRRRATAVAIVAAIPLVFVWTRTGTPKAKVAGTSAMSLPGVAPNQPVRVVQTRNGYVLPVVATASKDTWKVLTPCGRDQVVHGTPVGSVDVVIDPGHGGTEVGAVGNGLRESTLNLRVAVALQEQLHALGYTSLLTRNGDDRVSIETRAGLVRAARPRLFVSVHHNSGAAAHRSTPGAEVYYQHASATSRRLAGVIWERLESALAGLSMRQVGASDAGAIYRLGNDGRDYFGILRESAPVASVLIEPTYLSEPSQARLLRNGTLVTAEARAVALGIQRFLTSSDPGSGYETPLHRSNQDSGGGTTLHCTDPDLGG